MPVKQIFDNVMFTSYIVNFKSSIAVDLLDHMDFEILLLMLDMGQCLETNHMRVVKITSTIKCNLCLLRIVRQR